MTQKCFMVQDDQLRKWGKLTGWLMAVFTVFCFGAAALLHRLVGQMKVGMERLISEDEHLIDSAAVSAKVRTSLLETFDDHGAINADLLEALAAVPIGLVAFGFLAIYTGVLAVRAGELAHEVPEKKPAGIAG